MSNWNYLNKCRAGQGQFRTTPADGFNGYFCLILNSMRVKAIASDGMGWQHVSVSLNDSTQPPSWSIMCQIKDLFWDDGDWVVQFHPAKSEYVNQHPGCLHLWRCTTQEFLKPDSLMVGFRGPQDLERYRTALLNNSLSICQT